MVGAGIAERKFGRLRQFSARAHPKSQTFPLENAPEDTGGASREVVDGIKDLVDNFGQLRGEVETFLTEIKAA